MARASCVRLALAAAGLALAVWVIAGIDVDTAAGLLGTLGWGFLVVLLVAGLTFTADVASWHALLPAVPLDLRHGLRLWSVRAVGEMLNTVTPLAGMGGEPAKAALLARRFGLPLSDAIASVLAAKTTILLAFIPFLGIGCVLMIAESGIAPATALGFSAGFALFTAAIVAFFLVQRHRWASRLGGRLLGGRFAPAVDRALGHIAAVDGALQRLYTTAPRRLAASIAFAVLGWVLGAVELAVMAALMGIPLTPADAWMLEAAAQLVRQAGGFVPGSLGVTEAAMALLFGMLTGDPAQGVAVALVRRLREVVWIGLGLGLGARELPRRQGAR